MVHRYLRAEIGMRHLQGYRLSYVPIATGLEKVMEPISGWNGMELYNLFSHDGSDTLSQSFA